MNNKQKQEAKKKALAEYEKKIDEADAEYQKIQQPAYAEYKKKLREIETSE